MKIASALRNYKDVKSDIEIRDKFLNSELYKLINRSEEKFRNGEKYSRSLIVPARLVEGKDFNFRGFLFREGFNLVYRPNKTLLIMW